jgi:hypothetical protein
MISLWILVCIYIYILFSDKPISKNAWNIESINVTVSELITVRPPVIQLKKTKMPLGSLSCQRPQVIVNKNNMVI